MQKRRMRFLRPTCIVATITLSFLLLTAMIPLTMSQPAAASAAAGSLPEMHDRFGTVAVQLWTHDAATLNAEFDEMASMDIGWVRIDMGWHDIEPTQGGWLFSGWDQVLSLAQSHGIKVLAILGGSPSWANGGNLWNYPSSDLAAWSNYVTTVASRYKDKVSAWEIWNEENITAFWSPQPDPVAYMNLLRPAATALRAADPDGTIVMGGLAGLGSDFIVSTLQQGVADYVDAIAYHPYPETLWWGDYTPQESQCRYLVDFVHGTIAQYTTKDLQVWITEVGWTTSTVRPPGVDPNTQADYMLRTFLNYGSADLDKFFYFNFEDPVGGTPDSVMNYGLVNADLSEKPAAAMYRTFEGLLGTATPISPSTVTATAGTPATLELHSFRLPDGSLVVTLWKADAAADTVLLTVNESSLANPVSIDEATGQAQTVAGVTRDAQGNITVANINASGQPLLLKFGVPPKTAAISGTVTKTGGGALSGCRVKVFDSTTGALAGSATTNVSGLYSVAGLLSGSYRLSFTPGDDLYVGQWYSNKADQASATIVNLAAPANFTGADAMLQRAATNTRGRISGKVRKADGTALADIRVQVYQASTGNAVGSNNTDATGAYTVDALPAGNYQVSFQPADLYAPQWFEGSAAQADARVVGVSAEGNVSGIDAMLTQQSWYFAEGCTKPGFQEYLSLGNPDTQTAYAQITYMFSDGSSQQQEVSIEAHSRATVDVNAIVGSGRDVSVRVVSGQAIVVERPMYFDYAGSWTGGSDTLGARAPSQTWYFAEGCTSPGFDQWVCVLNPGDTVAALSFRFQTQEAGEKLVTGRTVAPHSRASFKINDLLGSDFQNSLKLESNQLVVAERSMYFDYLGTASNHWQGGDVVMGAPALARDYYFAEGSTRDGFEEWLTLQNPNSFAITVNATYQLGSDQGPPVQKGYVVEAGRRSTVSVAAEVGSGRDVSVRLTSTADFLAERPMYFRYRGFGADWSGGHCVIGATAAHSDWFFAEGYTGNGFHQYLCLQNPSDAGALVQVDYYVAGAGTRSETVAVPANSRVTISTNQQAGIDLQLSCALRVLSGPDIVVERPMYFNYNGWDGGHDVMGYAP